MRRVLLLDRDSVVVVPHAGAPVEELRLVHGAIPALLRLQGGGYELLLAEAFPERASEFVMALLASQGLKFSIFDPALTRSLDLERSALVAGRGVGESVAAPLAVLGVRRFELAESGSQTWGSIAHALLDRPRTASVSRRTRETDIRVIVDLDSEGEPHARTGLGFFDHMLEQLGKHGGFELDVQCTGDLHIDEHHTVEDVALTLGQALREALGDKRGIQRYGFLLPMDEADAEVSIDLGGRPYLVFEGSFPREQVGGLPTELVPHFFRSLAETLGAAIHVRVRGENTHHMIEVTFKAVARALRQAIKREGDVLPSTKGQL